MKKKRMNKLLASTLTLSIVSAFSGCTSDVNKEDEHIDSAVAESNAEMPVTSAAFTAVGSAGTAGALEAADTSFDRFLFR